MAAVNDVLLSELAIVGGTDFVSATLKSLVVILVTEIGDKTFFIAAVMILSALVTHDNLISLPISTEDALRIASSHLYIRSWP